MNLNEPKTSRTYSFLRAVPSIVGAHGAPGPSANREEEIAAVRAGKSLPMARLAEIRYSGMEAIQRELISRLVRADANVDTLSVYWEHAHEFVSAGELQEEARKLVFGHRYRVTGAFKDLWLVCYPDDDDARQAVSREIDRMVREAAVPASQRGH